MPSPINSQFSVFSRLISLSEHEYGRTVLFVEEQGGICLLFIAVDMDLYLSRCYTSYLILTTTW